MVDLYIEGFENLVKLLEKKYNVSDETIQDLYDIAVCQYNNELRDIFKNNEVTIKPIRRYIHTDAFVIGYIVTVKE